MKEERKERKEDRKKERKERKEERKERKEVDGVMRCTTNVSPVFASFNRTTSQSALTPTWHMATTHAGKNGLHNIL